MASQLYSDDWSDSSQEREQVTTVRRQNFSFVWAVNNFREFMNRKYEFSSPVFSRNLSSGMSKWKMMVFPENIYPEGTHVALRLLKISDDDRSYSVMYSISFADSNGKYHLLKTREKVFRHRQDFDECPITSNIAIKENCLLQNEALIISCKLDLLVCENQDDTVYKSYEMQHDTVCKPCENQDDTLCTPYEKQYDTVCKPCENPDNRIYKSLGSYEKVNIPSKIQSMNDLSYSKSYKRSVDDNEKNINALLDKDDNLLQAFTQKNPVYDSTSYKTDKSLEILSDDLKSLYYTTDQHDVTICADDGKLNAHELILTSRADYFKQAISQCGSEIHVPGINAVTLDTVLYYLYTGKLQQLTDHTAVDLLKACNILNLPHLRDLTQNFLKSQISVSNVTDVFRISKEMKMDSLKNCALKFVAENHEEVSQTHQWNQMMRNDPHSAGEVLLTVASFQNKLSNNGY